MTSAPLRIRPYADDDHDAVLSVHEAAFRASDIEFEPAAAVDEELRNVTETDVEGDDIFLVGTVNDVVATGGYRARSNADAEVGHLRVHPSVHRRGYAREMMAELERRAGADDFDRFVLETHEDLTAAQALYEDLGYHITDRVAHDVTGDEMIHYAKVL